MKLTYQTSVATLIQFITLSLLGIANAVNSIIFTCKNDASNCSSNFAVSIVFFVLTASWFGFIWLLGYAAQERRSKRLALLLIGVEGFVGLIAYFNARHYTDALGLATSLIDLMLALWIMTLAFRLFRSNGKRITKRRVRKVSKSAD